eukprot:TRINITY_DN4981_c0_g2_i1.p1 TRINITY_DN4981_c0_g2~~TRINITY_DN4981_c0_g2_i1.p1  ORF type:complete len:191 (+),score=29.28 TRINITY_DN4981_c0_g2_i1:93-665(+)
MVQASRLIAALEREKSEKEFEVIKLIQMRPLEYFIPSMDRTRRWVDLEKYDMRYWLDVFEFTYERNPRYIFWKLSATLQKYLRLFHTVPQHIDPLRLTAKKIRAGLNEIIALRVRILDLTPEEDRDDSHEAVITYLQHCARIFHLLAQQQRNFNDVGEFSYDTNNSNSASAADSDGWITIGKTHTRRPRQ